MYRQLGPRYEGQLTRMAKPIPLPVNPTRTHSRLSHHPVLRTDGRWRTGMVERRGRLLRTIFMPFGAKGVLYAWGLIQPANGPPTRTTSG